MPDKIIRIATRKSPLALWQARHIQAMLLAHWPDLQIELCPMVTSGDKFLSDKLLSVGGKGLFVKELEEALLDGRADLAVHSMKDVPAVFPEGLVLSAICQRDSPFDALVSHHYASLEALPKGARIGTSSLRRQSQLLAVRPDIKIEPLRGNIHTRLDKLDAHPYDAIILAEAGLTRMALGNRITQILTPEILMPACGQGALGIECRVDDRFIHDLITPLNHPLSAICVATERHVNALLGGNCHVPISVFSSMVNSSQLLLRARIASADGLMMIEDSQQGNQVDSILLAQRCVERLYELGAATLLDVKAS